MKLIDHLLLYTETGKTMKKIMFLLEILFTIGMSSGGCASQPKDTKTASDFEMSDGDIAHDMTQDVELLRKAAEQGDTEAQYNLGYIYLYR